MGAPIYLRHRSSLEHDTGAHPERIARIQAIEEELENRDRLGYLWEDSPAATDAQLEAVHPAEYVAGIEELCANGGGALDVDTLTSPGSARAARHAAGGAVRLVDALLGGEAPTAFSAHRPPGHHAETARAMGFCLFNSVAVAARHARDAHGVERVLILDWDVHHGNGTAEVFATDPGVLFLSIHQSPLYPGTGMAREVGSGAAQGYTVNVPVPAGSGDETFCSIVEHVAVPLGRAYQSQLILVSAGYDAHADDPLASCRVTEDGYATMTGSVMRLGAEVGAPVGALLEGGYDLGALSRSLAATLAALAAEPSDEPELAVHPIAEEAAARAARYWPAAGFGSTSRA